MNLMKEELLNLIALKSQRLDIHGIMSACHLHSTEDFVELNKMLN